MSVINFLTKNKRKGMTIRAYIYSAWYRGLIFFVEPKYLYKYWGERGSESQEDDTPLNYKYAAWVSMSVNRVCNHTKWESKCLVRALTAQKLLKRKGIHSTLYLGCGLEDGKMVAHAWLRVGKMYVTGGDGSAYSMVDKFSC